MLKTHSETAVEKLTILRDHLEAAEKQTPLSSRTSRFLGIGAVAELVEVRDSRAIGIYTSAYRDGVRIQYTENGQLTDAEQIFERNGDDVTVQYSRAALEKGLTLANMKYTVEFGRIGLAFLGDTSRETEYTLPGPHRASWDHVKYLDELARHFVCQATTTEQASEATAVVTPHIGIRLPIRAFNKRLPGHGNAPQLIRYLGSSTPDSMRLKSGLPLRFATTKGGECEGWAIVAVAGELEDLYNPALYPQGPLYRPHSACRASEGKTKADPYRLEAYFSEYRLTAKLFTPGFVAEHIDDMVFLNNGEHDPRCDCYEQLLFTDELIVNEGGMRADFCEQEGRGYGLINKEEMLRLAALKKLTTPQLCALYGVKPDIRVYDANAEALYRSGMRCMRILGNNPHKRAAYERANIEVISIPVVEVTRNNIAELISKREMGHPVPDENELRRLLARKAFSSSRGYHMP